jgi:hypothetical protein
MKVWIAWPASRIFLLEEYACTGRGEKMMENPNNQKLKALDEETAEAPWVRRYLQEELQKGLNNPARASKWFRDDRGWIEEGKKKDIGEPEHLTTRVPQPILRALKKYTADHNLTMQAFITEALEKALKNKRALEESFSR